MTRTRRERDASYYVCCNVLVHCIQNYIPDAAATTLTSRSADHEE
jgi:hypothetical protein